MKNNYPELYIFKGKYGNSYYIVNSKEGKSNMFLEVLEDRYKQGSYEWLKDYTPYDMKEPEYTVEDINKLPNSMTKEKKEMIKEINKYNIQLSQMKKFRKNYTDIQKAIENKDGTLAEMMILEFSDGEYEGFDRETPKIFE